jgi:hypothetical protein
MNFNSINREIFFGNVEKFNLLFEKTFKCYIRRKFSEAFE